MCPLCIIDIYGFYNAFMGVPPGHPTMKLAMEKITWYIRNDHKTVNEMDWTGPYVLKRAFNNFRKFREDKKWNPGTYQYNGEKMLLLKECSSGHVWVSFNCDNRNVFDRLFLGLFSSDYKRERRMVFLYCRKLAG